jgi:hypothetical protein
MKNNFILKYFEFAARIYVWINMSVYGAGKYIQFKGAAQLPQTIPELTGQQLMWAFFGYSQILPIFIGILQIIGSLLLLFDKTKLFGVALLLPILTNIILMDIVYHVNIGALFNAVLYFSILLFVLFFEKKKVMEIIKIISEKKENKEKLNRKELIKTVLITFVFVILFFVFGNVLCPQLMSLILK